MGAWQADGVNEPLVSVLLASRNGERYLDQALASLAAQTWGALEVVAVDDGSSDATPRVLEAFAATHLRVRVLRTTGVGLAGALALAAAHASGELFARQDDDDRSHPERLERQVRYLATHSECDVLGTEATMIDELGRPLRPYGVPLAPTAIRHATRRDSPFVHGSVVMRRTAYEHAGGYRPMFRSSEDLDLWLRMAPERFANLPDALYEWRWHGAGGFARRRDAMIEFAAIARAFAAERRERGGDSAELFARQPDFEAFLGVYRGAGRLALEYGIALLRDRRAADARRWFARAFGSRQERGAAALGWLASWPAAALPRRRPKVSA